MAPVIKKEEVKVVIKEEPASDNTAAIGVAIAAVLLLLICIGLKVYSDYKDMHRPCPSAEASKKHFGDDDRTPPVLPL
jgi:hypothetical protein